MVAFIGFAALLLIVATTLLHYEVLRLLNRGLSRLRWTPRARVPLAVLGCFAGHAAEVALYGLAFWLLARHGIGLAGPQGASDLGAALYFSAETYTSLGFGDVIPTGALRLLAGVEALNGLLLIGWSASYLYLEMERDWAPGR
jgi:hypothetical protein